MAGRRVNWLPKSENLRSLARELNLGLDSFILVDDNPVECAEVEAGAPQVLAVQLPEATASLPRFLRHVWAFDYFKVTEEDRQRGERYEQNRIRQQFLATATSLADFVAGLNLVINIAPARPEHLPRIAQLTQRTNQFNCTTRRRSDGEIEELFASGKAEILAVHVTDRFGDYGLVGVIIYTSDREAITADTFLLSCRALGKGVEHRMLAFLGESAAKRGLRRVDVPFKPTAKNQPALDFLSSIGAAYHQGHDGKSVFRFPADFAAGVRFEPHAAANTPLAGNSKGSDANPQPGNTAEDWLPEYKRYGWIARNAYDAIQIQQLIELQATFRQTSTDAPYEAPRGKLETELCDLWRQLLRVERVGIHDDFFALGGTSLLAVRMIAELEKLTGRKLPLVTVFRTPSIAQIAQSLDQKPGAPGNRTAVVAIQPKGSRPPLFLVHGAGGGILWGYANLAAYLGGDQPVYGLDPGQADLASQPTVEQMAAAYVRDIRTIQPVGPYYLGGYCFGGYVAYEMARQLTQQGQAIGLLALIDSAAPNGPYERVPWWRPAFYPRFIRNSLYWLQDFRQLPPDTRREFFRRKLDVLRRKVAGRLRPLRGKSPEIILEEYIDTTQFPEHERQLWQMHLTAGARYIPKPFAGRVTLLRTHGQPLLCSLDPQYGWRELAGDGVDVRLVPGAHENIFVEPEVQTLAAELSAALNGAHVTAPSPQLS
jgi:FkbH-like protein